MIEVILFPNAVGEVLTSGYFMWVKLIPKAYPPKYFSLIGSVVGVHNSIKIPHTFSPGLHIQHCGLLSPTPGC